MTYADSPADHVPLTSSGGVPTRRRTGRAMVLVPAVAAALIVGVVVVADAATTTSALTVCVQRGAPLVAPTASGRCPAGYTLTRVAGARGPAGAAGHDGAAGATGSPGATGVAGPTGATGPQGTAGATGPAGTAGATGATGATGLQGPTGPAGTPGSAGERGSAGATGPQGVPGPQGLPGPEGAPGPQGSAGPTGDPGADGTGPAWLDTGDPTVYTATDTHTLAGVTLPAGTYALNASVYVTNGANIATVSVLTCSWDAPAGATLQSPQPPVIREPENTLRDDVVSLPPAILAVGSGTRTVSLVCASTNYGTGFTLTGTVLATRVSSATVT